MPGACAGGGYRHLQQGAHVQPHLSGAENLKLICVTATGINNIDLDYVKRHNIAVTNVAGYSTVSVPAHLCDVLLSGRKTPLLR